MQEIKKENKALEVLYEKLDFLQENWTVQGVIGDIKKQVTGLE